ncbi:hypothetical protein GPECTOR_39g434 [Gonium pectorale]|uniref:Uncharacterized protein n=1 Tax=Gonium pectorale TaxID=33097 RepID=A0A150GC56_GONPE|nr:hypothetical protein GPECTOR_39g434 [Gonium pectorale]|eukprot:KXZ46940.1 hypothetical protein GPECTOR_39g434 [Gonium pectorale]
MYAEIPLLSLLQAFICQCQQRDGYVASLLYALDRTMKRINELYISPDTAFTGEAFAEMEAFLDVGTERSSLLWTDEGHLARLVDGEWLDVKQQLTGIAEAVLEDLARRFPPVPVLEALELAYPEYWRGTLQLDGSYKGPDADDFRLKASTLQRYFGTTKPAPSINAFGAGAGGGSEPPLQPLLDVEKLTQQRLVFASEAQQQAAITFTELEKGTQFRDGHYSAFWSGLTRMPYIADSCSEWVRLGKLAATLVPGAVEAERIFSTMSFIKNKQRNRLEQQHLSVAVRLMVQDWYTVSDFPYDRAIAKWRSIANHRWAEPAGQAKKQ